VFDPPEADRTSSYGRPASQRSWLSRRGRAGSRAPEGRRSEPLRRPDRDGTRTTPRRSETCRRAQARQGALRSTPLTPLPLDGQLASSGRGASRNQVRSASGGSNTGLMKRVRNTHCRTSSSLGSSILPNLNSYQQNGASPTPCAQPRDASLSPQPLDPHPSCEQRGWVLPRSSSNALASA